MLSVIDKELILMVGPIGSGKTTFAKSLENNNSIRISQDEMGRKQYLKNFKEAIDQEIPRIIVDRQNFNREQRARFIEPAREAGYIVTIFEMGTPKELCIQRVVNRKAHPTVKGEDPELAESILNMFERNYEKPTEVEFDNYNLVEE
jgi:predicted kinase